MQELNLLKHANILFVEDDKQIASIIIEKFKNICNNIDYCEDGKLGLNFYKQNHKKIDIIITDIRMPKLNGIEMVRSIREQDVDIPIIMITAFEDQKILKELINLRVDGFLAKPITIDELYNILIKVFKPIYYHRQLLEKDILIFQQSKQAAIGEMIENIAHQWRQPLNTIGALMMKLELNNEHDKLTQEIISQTINDTNQVVEHMSKTIDDFRDFFIPNKEKDFFVIQNTMNSLSYLMVNHLEDYNIKFIITGDTNIKLYGYENELKQVLLNIIGNAKDAIRNNDIENGFIEVNIEKSGDNIVLSIKDNAGGIPQEIISKIFEPYFTTKFKSQGTGLGLYISNVIIVKNMNGMLSVSSDNYGTIFKITLPIN